MNDDTLLGYLLDALDRDERRDVEAYLRAPPGGARLAGAAGPTWRGRWPPTPTRRSRRPASPKNAVANIAAAAHRRLPAAPPPSRQAGAAPRRGPRRSDLVVAGLALLLSAGVAVAWLGRQWHSYRVVACQSNLHRLWTALQAAADQHPADGGAFPRVEAAGTRGFAGVFVPTLADAGALGPDATTACPEVDGPRSTPCSFAELDDLARNHPCEYRARARDLGGDYAYTLGYRRGDELVGLTRGDGELLPILADRPRGAGVGNSPNHGGAGQNVLYIGGQVRWCAGPNVGVDQDDIYRNLNLQVFAGRCEFDTVLGASDASPCPVP